ncbi:putative 50S ribosomal subunit protein L23 [Candidatus Tremblaya princeps]|uniref:Putative 50S ribosomal subunit protein L23 n=1 Tax=Tremblaya princeps TaxID=189385 RepID=A0A143WR26_TREPR|nr:putative 50S ribosomal subunit protein L23 [Candidatus Tremblaya princeps]
MRYAELLSALRTRGLISKGAHGSAHGMVTITQGANPARSAMRRLAMRICACATTRRACRLASRSVHKAARTACNAKGDGWCIGTTR